MRQPIIAGSKRSTYDEYSVERRVDEFFRPKKFRVFLLGPGLLLHGLNQVAVTAWSDRHREENFLDTVDVRGDIMHLARIEHHTYNLAQSLQARYLHEAQSAQDTDLVLFIARAFPDEALVVDG